MRFSHLHWLLALAMSSSLLAEKVYVFHPSMTRPNAVQAALQSKCPGSDITVFGRLADFTAMIAQVPPDAIVAPQPLAEQFDEFKPFLKGTLKGLTNEDAVLVSTKPVDPDAPTSLNVGVVGILERPAMNGFVRTALGGLPKIKTVTKVEDLLPLLAFGGADAILVGESQVDEIRSRSQAVLRTTIGAGRIPLVVAAARGTSGKFEACLKGLGPNEKRMLGVDGWTK